MYLTENMNFSQISGFKDLIQRKLAVINKNFKGKFKILATEFYKKENESGIGIRLVNNSSYLRFNFSERFNTLNFEVRNKEDSKTINDYLKITDLYCSSIDYFDSLTNLNNPKTIFFYQPVNIFENFNKLCKLFNTDAQYYENDLKNFKLNIDSKKIVLEVKSTNETNQIYNDIVKVQEKVKNLKYCNTSFIYDDIQSVAGTMAYGRQTGGWIYRGLICCDIDNNIISDKYIIPKLKEMLGVKNSDWFMFDNIKSSDEMYQCLFAHKDSIIVFKDSDAALKDVNTSKMIKNVLSFENKVISYQNDTFDGDEENEDTDFLVNLDKNINTETIANNPNKNYYCDPYNINDYRELEYTDSYNDFYNYNRELRQYNVDKLRKCEDVTYITNADKKYLKFSDAFSNDFKEDDYYINNDYFETNNDPEYLNDLDITFENILKDLCEAEKTEADNIVPSKFIFNGGIIFLSKLSYSELSKVFQDNCFVMDIKGNLSDETNKLRSVIKDFKFIDTNNNSKNLSEDIIDLAFETMIDEEKQINSLNFYLIAKFIEIGLDYTNIKI